MELLAAIQVTSHLCGFWLFVHPLLREEISTVYSSLHCPAYIRHMRTGLRKDILMCSLAVSVAYSTFSKRITNLNYMRIWSTSEVTCSFPLQLNTADLHQQQPCDGLSPGGMAGWRAGCRSWGPWGNDWHSQPDFEQLWSCKAYAGPLFQSHAPERCRAWLQLIHCPPRNRTTWRTGVVETIGRTDQMRQK